MLVFTRKKEESFVIEMGDDVVKVTLNDVFSSPKQAQIGIDAPKHIKIWRSELYESVLENKQATQSASSPKNLKDFFKK